MNSPQVSLVGVYDADGTFVGEVCYWVGARIGRAHCSLCEITHGVFREKQEWRDCRASLGVQFTTFHRDDAPVDVLDACMHQLPVVVARSGSEIFVVLDAEELERLSGDVEKFYDALIAGCAKWGIAIG